MDPAYLWMGATIGLVLVFTLMMAVFASEPQDEEDDN
jgi:hypothetical protein